MYSNSSLYLWILHFPWE
ncbi:hypothetical protein MTR67_017928 [Solanum verrucosum]|uniref:Uncharacterized protein n=1 Tax=Solanum verrucosum TaxID=315347 RepID=A0AAF0QLG7_SOLVR|nr:hypothetical protein MTR67_017928 [Solanum verrucosum]